MLIFMASEAKNVSSSLHVFFFILKRFFTKLIINFQFLAVFTCDLFCFQFLHPFECFLLQKAVFAKFPDLRSFALANVASVDTRDALFKHFGSLRYFFLFF